MQIALSVNGEARTVEADDDTPLLWVLRETLGLNGTKFGCGVGACGACTVHVDGAPTRSCSVPAALLQGRSITTIEGLAPVDASGLRRSDGTAASRGLHPVQEAWVRHQVPQCGYCQSGMIMAVSALLARTPNPTDEQIDAEITNICRCGTYERVRRAIHDIAARPAGSAGVEGAAHG